MSVQKTGKTSINRSLYSVIVFVVPYVDRNTIASFVISLFYKDLTHYDSRRDALVGFVYYVPTKGNAKLF